MWWTRFFDTIHFKTDEPISINCDNAQTVKLMQNASPRLNTKLCHVDIHQCWLRQQVQSQVIDIEWVPTNEMHVDGFTKLLGPQAHQRFVQQLGMMDLEHVIKELKNSTPSVDTSREFQSLVSSGKP
jgi:hypothetical protein